MPGNKCKYYGCGKNKSCYIMISNFIIFQTTSILAKNGFYTPASIQFYKNKINVKNFMQQTPFLSKNSIALVSMQILHKDDNLKGQKTLLKPFIAQTNNTFDCLNSKNLNRRAVTQILIFLKSL